jgi:hypothetical protein
MKMTLFDYEAVALTNCENGAPLLDHPVETAPSKMTSKFALSVPSSQSANSSAIAWS